MDVKSLDANIPNCKGIKEEVIGKLNAHTDKPIPTRIIIKFLYLISAVNNFLTKSISYLQINVCSMGTTENFLGKFETTHAVHHTQSNNIRYIEDLFFIWKRKEEELLPFMEDLSKKNEN